MVVDTSAVMALLLQEPDAEAIDALLRSSASTVMSAANHVELMIVVEARTGPAGVLIAEEALLRLGIEIVAVTSAIARQAIAGWRRFGKGRHGAALNFGDCFSYGLAIERGDPLLFVGDDFSRTDAVPALVT